MQSLGDGMPRVGVRLFSVSLDGFGAGLKQSLEDPLGQRGLDLHQWLFATRTFCDMTGQAGGSTGVDDQYAAAGFTDVGAYILGRNMFGPVRGDWPDDQWKGWWGDEPPFHAPTFVLTCHPRAPLKMKGGTTFYFVTDGADAALAQARAAAGNKDVRVGGGVKTLRQYLQARLIDELHLAIVPVVLGQGEALFRGIDLPALGYRIVNHEAGEAVTHVVLNR